MKTTDKQHNTSIKYQDFPGMKWEISTSQSHGKPLSTP